MSKDVYQPIYAALAAKDLTEAHELEPEGPAKECRLKLIDIMEFCNKDMFNQ
mgnify:CR=1 FL=1